MFFGRICSVLALMAFLASFSARAESICIDDFCIGESINAERFGQVRWLVPQQVKLSSCLMTTCVPEAAFRGYSPEDQDTVARALDLQIGIPFFNVVTNDNLAALRRYKYECNPSPRGGIFGERRFVGFFKSEPSNYLTAVGLRIVGGGLRVYRIVRRFPYHATEELSSLARNVERQYDDAVLVVNYLSSNATTEVIKKEKYGWFGRSELFNPSNPTDNIAELVVIDPHTRNSLEPTSWPRSGEIRPVAGYVPSQCNKPMSLN